MEKTPEQNTRQLQKSHPKNEFIIREIQRGDIRKGYLESLRNLSKLDTSAYELQERVFDERKRLILRWNKTEIPVYYTVVAVFPSGEVFATATLLTELKAIHDGGLVGHIEDVSRRKDKEMYRGLGGGRACVEELIKFARETGGYKTILDCSDGNMPFYESLGFKKHENSMRLDL